MHTDDKITPKTRRTAAGKAPRPTQGASRHLRVVTASTVDETPKAKPKSRLRTGPNMVTGLTDKQEAFVQSVASGSNLSDAYRQAYDADRMSPQAIWTEASVLLAAPKVSSRLMVLNQEKEQQRRMMAVSRAERVLQRLETLAESAATESVRVRANELLGKTAGLFTDQVEVTTSTDRSVDDIQQAITDRLRRLGLAG
jgi:phage gp46-like protein